MIEIKKFVFVEEKDPVFNQLDSNKKDNKKYNKIWTVINSQNEVSSLQKIKYFQLKNGRKFKEKKDNKK